jgi:hypothetical protein
MSLLDCGSQSCSVARLAKLFRSDVFGFPEVQLILVAVWRVGVCGELPPHVDSVNSISLAFFYVIRAMEKWVSPKENTKENFHGSILLILRWAGRLHHLHLVFLFLRV